MKTNDRNERIMYYEAAMDEVRVAIDNLEAAEKASQAAAEALEAARAVFGAMGPRADELAVYYDGGEWRKDFEADEAGLLPDGLKRGVLSEDGLYNLLAEYDALRNK